MKRAAILIGVSHAEGLTKLHAVADGVKFMRQWALEQGMNEEHVITITDENGGRVSGDDVELAVLDMLNDTGLEQLIIYFAGHGVTLDLGQVWYLSRALESASQAINVDATIKRASLCGLDHVVLISDACRTAPKTVQDMGTMGRPLFSNPKAGAKRTFVDVFYATRLGAPSNEINNQESSEGYRAIFTDSLLHALRGKNSKICEDDETLGTKVVRPWPLSDFLADDVPARYMKLTGDWSKTQEPESYIHSREGKNWISDVNLVQPTGHESFDVPIETTDETLQIIRSARSAMEASGQLVKGLIRGPDHVLKDAVLNMVRARVEALREVEHEKEFEESTVELMEPFGPTGFESQCGFKIRGAKIVEVHCKKHHRIHEDQQAVGIDTAEPQSTLLVFDNGYGTLLAALPEFVGSLTVSESRDSSAKSKIVLSDFHYEPDVQSGRYSSFESSQDRIRGLRAVIATSVQRGNFRLQGDDAAELSRSMQLGKSIDPSLALYSAHGYSRLGGDERLEEMYYFMKNDLGRVPLDVGLLAEKMIDKELQSHEFVPFLPMLSQSWSLLPAYDVKFPNGLEGIDRHMVHGSLWTLYTPAGVELIRNAFETGDLN